MQVVVLVSASFILSKKDVSNLTLPPCYLGSLKKIYSCDIIAVHRSAATQFVTWSLHVYYSYLWS